MPFMQIPKQFNVIPVSNKVPQIAWKEYTERQQTIEERNKFISSKQQLGIVTGKVSGIIVLDDDGGLNLETHPIPKTWTARTPRGGTHYYFKWQACLDDKISTKTELFQKVDVRGNGGYVVHYGFRSPTTTTPLANPPQWLIDLLPNKEQTQKSAILKLEEAKEGNRNDTLFKAASSLRGRGLPYEEIYRLLKPQADELNYPDSELQVLCASACKYKPRISNIDTDDSICQLSTVLSETLKTEWIVNPTLISRQSITFIVGLPEARKTWILMDLALSISTGTKWLGQFECKKNKVIYLDQERSRASTIERFNQLLTGRELQSKDLDDTLLLKPQSRVKLNLEQSFESFSRVCDKFKPDIVLIDSFKKIHSSNELSSQDMQSLFTKIEELKDRFSCSFVFIHHEPKGVIQKRKENFEVRATDASGTVDLQQTAEHFFNVVDDQTGSMLYHTKNNLGNKISPVLVKVEDQNESKTSIKITAY